MNEKADRDFLVPHVVGSYGLVPRDCPAKSAKTCVIVHQSFESNLFRRISRTIEEIEWHENKPFKAALCLSHLYSSSQSNNCQAVLFNTEKKYGYVMREEDFVHLLKTLPAITGVFVGEWVFRKSGRYISVCQA